jgi:hypothetical protein
MHKNATKCNKTLSKWCKNKHGASKIIDTLETYHPLVKDIDVYLPDAGSLREGGDYLNGSYGHLEGG